VFKPHGIILEQARKVAEDLGLPYWFTSRRASTSPVKNLTRGP
jgi:hypothetical protein